MVVPSTENELRPPLMLRRVADGFDGTDCQKGMAGLALVGIPPLILFTIFRR